VPQNAVILVVDDNQDDVLLIQRAFKRAGVKHSIQSVPGGLEAIAYLSGEPPYRDRGVTPLPLMVLLDIRMIRVDGFEVLRWIRRHPAFARLPVIMLTSSDEISDVNTAYQLGATSFLVKPLDFWIAAELSRSIERYVSRNADGG
jgi:CheY-like chemotaxis protein